MYIREYDHSAFSGLPLLTRKIKGEVERDVWRHGTSEAAKAEAHSVMTHILGSLGPANVKLLEGIDVQLHIIPHGTKVTDLLEFTSLKGKPTFDGRLYDDLRGIGGQRFGSSILYAAGEETLIPIPGTSAKPPGRVVSHESGHVVSEFALTDSQKKRLQDVYAARKKTNGPWLRDYAGSNQHEYFAEATSAFFGYSPSYDSGYRAVYTRAYLKKTDLPMYRLLSDVYKRAP